MPSSTVAPPLTLSAEDLVRLVSSSSFPPLAVVEPVYVLAPVSWSVPGPLLVSAPEPAMTPP
jgi:hypothetical protein